jgi:glycosyltransferase involved in cell wall biosynthesis
MQPFFSLPLHYHIVGNGWRDHNFEFISDDANLTTHGFISDAELDKLYSEISFVFVPLIDGAGVKGKIIEAMQRDKIVVTTEIGGQGIPSEILPTFNDGASMARYMLDIINHAELHKKTILGYRSFLNEQYTHDAYDNLVDQLTLNVPPGK